MKQAQLDLMKELRKVMEPIIKRYIEVGSLDVADIVYCSVWEAEEISLQTKREMKKKLLKKGEQDDRN